MKRMLSCWMLLALATVGCAQEAAKTEPAVPSYKAGGTAIAIPSPASELAEVGEGNRKTMNVFVPEVNRLLAAFLLTDDLKRLTGGSIKPPITKYALVEVPRRGENVDIAADKFKEMADRAKKEMEDVIESASEKAGEELSRRMKSLDQQVAAITIGKRVKIGTFFSKEDAYGFGFVSPISSGGSTVKMGVAVVLVRVKNRLLFLYLYAEYKNQETAKWLQKTAEQWADATLKANRE
jgi:hypothetical protein